VAFPPATWACRVTKAQHITLVLEGADPHFEIQPLEFDPPPGTDPGAHPTNLRKLGFNHLAFRVDDMEAATAHLVANGVTVLSEEMDYISRNMAHTRRLALPDGAKACFAYRSSLLR